MKEKNGTAMRWIIFSVLSVIVPVLIAILLSLIVTKQGINISEIMDSIILVVFSISCSLCSICYDVFRQKSSKYTTVCFWVSGVMMFVSWLTYIVSLSNDLKYIKAICICCLFMVILCSILGVLLGKKSDKNDNEFIYSMHSNCLTIRKKFIEEHYNKGLNSQVKNPNELLCNPDTFDRISDTIDYILEGDNPNE